MNYIEHLPALIRVLAVFVIIVVLIHKKVSLGNTFLIGSIILSQVFEMKPGPVATSILHAMTDPKTLSLALVVSLILVLSNSMEQGGQMERLLNNFKGLVHSPGLNLVIFPAMIGLLPMPGGAVFSAPMVRKLGGDSPYSPAQLSFINYWFRHIWEYWWPLYPGVLLAVVLADIHLAGFMAIMFPLTLLAVWTGFRLLNGHAHGPDTGRRNPPPRPAPWPFIRELIPIIIAIGPGLGCGFLLALAFPSLTVNKELGLVIALSAAVAWVWRANRISMERIKSMLLSPKLLNMIYMIVGILVFKGILEDSRAVSAISGELLHLDIPLVLIVVVLPLLVGTVTGITIAFVGGTFPILIPLIRTVDPGGDLLPYMMLAIGSGFAGVMLSPVHLCLILSNEYFETGMATVYRHLWMPCGLLIAACLGYYWMLRAFGF